MEELKELATMANPNLPKPLPDLMHTYLVPPLERCTIGYTLRQTWIVLGLHCPLHGSRWPLFTRYASCMASNPILIYNLSCSDAVEDSIPEEWSGELESWAQTEMVTRIARDVSEAVERGRNSAAGAMQTCIQTDRRGGNDNAAVQCVIGFAHGVNRRMRRKTVGTDTESSMPPEGCTST